MYHHDRTAAKKTSIMTKTRALVYHILQDSLIKRIKYEALDLITYCEKSPNPVSSRYISVKLTVRCSLRSTPSKSLHNVERLCTEGLLTIERSQLCRKSLH